MGRDLTYTDPLDHRAEVLEFKAQVKQRAAYDAGFEDGRDTRHTGPQEAMLGRRSAVFFLLLGVVVGVVLTLCYVECFTADRILGP